METEELRIETMKVAYDTATQILGRMQTASGSELQSLAEAVHAVAHLHEAIMNRH